LFYGFALVNYKLSVYNKISVLFLPIYSKCHKYSPSAPSKAYDKMVSRKPGVIFNPEQVIDYVIKPGKERPNEELAKVYYDVSTILCITLFDDMKQFSC